MSLNCNAGLVTAAGKLALCIVADSTHDHSQNIVTDDLCLRIKDGSGTTLDDVVHCAVVDISCAPVGILKDVSILVEVDKSLVNITAVDAVDDDK